MEAQIAVIEAQTAVILPQIKKNNGAYFFLMAMAMAMVRCGRMAVLPAPPGRF